MRLATIRTPDGPRAVRVDDDRAVDCGFADVGAALRTPDWRRICARAEGPVHELDRLRYEPVVLRPDKIFCVGLNYTSHIREMGRDLPEHPTLFAKYASTLTGAQDDIALPRETDAMDWEAELAVVVGSPLRHADTVAAGQAIAGYTVANDVTMRDWQFRTREWLQGKNFEATTPLGPHLVTSDEMPLDARITCQVDGETVQEAAISDLLFPPAALLSYISTFTTLQPGDVILTGTPGGVGHAQSPARYLAVGNLVSVSVEGVGETVNRIIEPVGNDHA